MIGRGWTGVLVLLVIGLAGCSGARGARDRAAGPAAETPVAVQVPLAGTETFDPSAYPDDPPAERVEVEHKVPDRLLASKAGENTRKAVRGYRIQLYKSADKASADRQVTRVIDWWNARREQGGVAGLFGSGQPPVYTVYRQPYYSVRVGDFGNRQQAERALAAMRDQFPGALIVIDTIGSRP